MGSSSKSPPKQKKEPDKESALAAERERRRLRLMRGRASTVLTAPGAKPGAAFLGSAAITGGSAAGG